MQKYKTLKTTIYYNFKHIKDKIVYNLIMWLLKFTDVYLFKNITIEHTENEACYGRKYFYIKDIPHGVLKTDFITKK